MVFVSANKDAIRKCKWCDLPAKKHIDKNGRFKSYYKTCGLEACLKQQYKDKWICLSKGKTRGLVDYICACCGKEFTPISPPHKRYCLECCPDRTWRGRANRYGVGKKQWDYILTLQNNKCALCDRNPEVVDHCHKTQAIRGLLCNLCNVQLHKMDTDFEWLKKALGYLGIEYASITLSGTTCILACQEAPAS